MEKSTSTNKRSPSDELADGAARDELIRELGLDELSWESCFRSLFGEPPERPRTDPAVRVVQLDPREDAEVEPETEPETIIDAEYEEKT